jgi:Spy/CpxP family protein refolding chaperone
VLSATLNLVFVGIWGAHFLRVHWSTQENRYGPLRAGGVPCPLHRRLGVTQEQWRRIEPRMLEFRSALQANCEEISRKRVEMINLLAVPKPNLQAIAAKQKEILVFQGKTQKLVIDHLLAEKEMLTPKQQKELFRLLRRYSACTGPGSLMGLQPGAYGQGEFSPNSTLEERNGR